MFSPGFAYRRIAVGEVVLNVAIGGDGPPLVLLHGFPQTHVAWHAVAPRLAARFTVICPDLRGYGDSDKPPGDDAHDRYAKRALANDILALLRELGHRWFAVVGHDRGALVGFRLALDHPEAVSHLAVLDALPTIDMWDALCGPFGVSAFHLYLLAQPAPFPERLSGASADLFLAQMLDGWYATPGALLPVARERSARAFHEPRTIAAICEDYRAGATCDLAHDRADRDAGKRIAAPLLVLWQEPQGVDLPFDPLTIYRRWADDVQGHPLPCGHFLPEERPDDVAEAIELFMRA